MKYLLTVLLIMAFITIGCKKNATESNNDEIYKYSSVNVKTATEYFSFANNAGSTDATAAHDIVFYSFQWQPAPQAPVISDPRFRAKDGMSIAVLNNTNIADVSEVPAMGDFVANFVSESGEWYDQTDMHVIVPKENVYIVNTADGKFPAFEITNYYDDQGNSGVFSIEWKYLSE